MPIPPSTLTSLHLTSTHPSIHPHTGPLHLTPKCISLTNTLPSIHIYLYLTNTLPSIHTSRNSVWMRSSCCCLQCLKTLSLSSRRHSSTLHTYFGLQCLRACLFSAPPLYLQAPPSLLLCLLQDMILKKTTDLLLMRE